MVLLLIAIVDLFTCQVYHIEQPISDCWNPQAGDGHVVVGSDDGKIRLFSSSTLTMAKTSIPGLGAPITAVSVCGCSQAAGF